MKVYCEPVSGNPIFGTVSKGNPNRFFGNVGTLICFQVGIEDAFMKFFM